ncbi:MAG: peptidase M50 family protein [Acidimicrobiaceae bacterium]|nr:MAG: peptidase M50 family protein [Acidimicrobiaceae bacterium]
MKQAHTALDGGSTPDQVVHPPNETSYVKLRNEILAGGASDTPGVEDTAGGARAVVGLGIIAALLAWLAVASVWSFVFVVLLLVCIFLHEVGHFVTARWTGMKATQFFLFMGPKLWSFRRGETEYGVRAYPVGAYVRIIGMNNLDEVDPEDEPRAYRNQSYPKRMLVICAGSLMHMLIAVSLLFGVYATKGQLQPNGKVAIGKVVQHDPADIAGVEAGDVIVSLEGLPIASADQFVSQIQRRTPGDTVTLVVERDGVQQTIMVNLVNNPNPGPNLGKAYMGVQSGSQQDWQGMSIVDAARHSVTDLGEAAWLSVGGVVKVLNPVNIYSHLSGSNTDQSTQPTTVVGVSRYSDLIGGETGVGGILIMLAGVNVFVGLLNLFPMLPFDGGHAAIATYERIRSRRGQQPYRADVAKMIPVALTMMGLLVFLLLAGLYLDIVRPLG